MKPQTNLIIPEVRSVTRQKDARILEVLIPLHAPVKNPYIVDCTYGPGVMWEGCGYQPDWRTDLRQMPGLDAIDNFLKLETVDRAEVIVFDPPHIPASASGGGIGERYGHRYGISKDAPGKKADKISEIFEPFLQAAKRVLADNGIVLAKIADLINSNCCQWQHVDFINACFSIGFTPCDMVVKINTAGSMISGSWKNKYHVRKTHSYWIVARKGDRCQRPPGGADILWSHNSLGPDKHRRLYHGRFSASGEPE